MKLATFNVNDVNERLGNLVGWLRAEKPDVVALQELWTMKRKITGFHTDAENHGVAELECGHGQHMRHDPPWMERPWVTTESSRQSPLGEELNCVRCDKLAREISQKVIVKCRETLIAAYEVAGASGLSDEGRWEVALDSLRTIDLSKIIS
jgi:hypothetical protein